MAIGNPAYELSATKPLMRHYGALSNGMTATPDGKGAAPAQTKDGAESGFDDPAFSWRAICAFPGPVLLLSAQGRLIQANSAAAALQAAFEAGSLPSVLPWLNNGAGRPLVVNVPLATDTCLTVELSALACLDRRWVVLGRDITLDRNLRLALVESRQRYKDLVDISSDFAWEVGADGRFVFVSPKGAIGFAADELVGRNPAQFIIAHDDADGPSPFAPTDRVEDAPVWVRPADGGRICLLASATAIRDENGTWRGARGVCRDVTQERLRDHALSRANNRERLLSYIVRTIRDEVEPIDMLRAAAEATARALGATGCQIFRLKSDDNDFALAAQFGEAGNEATVLDAFLQSDHVDKSADDWHILATVSRYRHSINGAVLLWRHQDRPAWSDDERLLIDDLANQVGLANEQITNHERILRLSRTDSLTGLYNRRAFFDEIARRFQRLSLDHRPAALLYVDLDNFKCVNDAHGHQTGDRALLAVCDLLTQHTRPTDIVARLGGDEFAIWLENADETVAVSRCQELQIASAPLEEFSGQPDRPLRLSMGVAVHPGQTHETLDALIARADAAMYDVKRGGKGAWRLAPSLDLP